MYLESDDAQFSCANESLAKAIDENPKLGNEFSNTEFEQIYSNQNPDGYTWNHNEEPGKLELVDEELHAETGTSGGRELWGGGEEHR